LSGGITIAKRAPFTLAGGGSMWVRRLVSLLALAAACSQPTDDLGSSALALNDPVPTSAGLYPLAVDSSGDQRAYLLYLPFGYDQNRATPYPLVLMFHGLGGNATALATTMTNVGMKPLVDTQGKIVVFMQGTLGTAVDTAGFWNFTGSTLARDDHAYTDRVIARLSRHLNVDENRIYGAGHSLGGAFLHDLATTDPDRFAAIADVSGFYATATYAPSPPPAGTLMPVLIVHASDDPIVPHLGGPGLLGAALDFEPTQYGYDTWYADNGCTEPTLQAITCTAIPPPGGVPICWDIQTTDCLPGLDRVVEFVLFGPHDHSWPEEADGVDAAETMLEFFDQH
jgi:poly(3-hydroxybutyrate) depolymerase